VVAYSGSDLAGIAKLRQALDKQGAALHVIAPVGGVLTDGTNEEIVERTLLTARSIEFDAIVVADGTALTGDIKLVLLLQEAYRHCKPVGAWGSGTATLEATNITPDGPGVVTGKSAAKSFTDNLIAAVGLLRAWDRAPLVMTIPGATGHLTAHRACGPARAAHRSCPGRSSPQPAALLPAGKSLSSKRRVRRAAPCGTEN
jgi:catalase